MSTNPESLRELVGGRVWDNMPEICFANKLKQYSCQPHQQHTFIKDAAAFHRTGTSQLVHTLKCNYAEKVDVLQWIKRHREHESKQVAFEFLDYSKSKGNSKPVDCSGYNNPYQGCGPGVPNNLKSQQLRHSVCMCCGCYVFDSCMHSSPWLLLLISMLFLLDSADWDSALGYTCVYMYCTGPVHNEKAESLKKYVD